MICLKGMKISNFLIKSEKITLPMLDTKYLAVMPMWKECYILVERQNNNLYKLMKFIIIVK